MSLFQLCCVLLVIVHIMRNCVKFSFYSSVDNFWNINCLLLVCEVV